MDVPMTELVRKWNSSMHGKSLSLIFLCINITKRRFTSFEKDALNIIKLGLRPEDFSKCVVVVATNYDRISMGERSEVDEFLPKLLASLNKNLGCQVTMANVIRSTINDPASSRA